MKKSSMNLPNTLSIIRCFLVPVFVATLLLMRNAGVWGYVVPALVYGLTAFTDMLDGKIARKHNLITDFGKFIDPLADKFMVIGALLVILYKYDNIRPVFIWAVIIVIFRELAVTSIRLVASSSSGVVIAANWLGKIKTVTQIVCICAVIIEPILYTIPFLVPLAKYLPITYASTALMVIFTIWSGMNYILTYWKFLDPQK